MWAALTLAGHSGTVRCLHLHNNRLVSGSSDRTIKVCELARIANMCLARLVHMTASESSPVLCHIQPVAGNRAKTVANFMI